MDRKEKKKHTDEAAHVSGYTQYTNQMLWNKAPVTIKKPMRNPHQQASMTYMGTTGLPPPRSTAATACE